MLLMKKIHKLMKNVKLYRSLGIIIVFILISSLIFYSFEININPRINTIQDAIWWGFVTSTSVGYGDIYPVTIIGRIISIFLMLIGIGVFGFITGSFASIFLEENIRKGMGLMDVIFKNHIIIIGWNHKTKIIIEELINEDKNLKVVIIDNIDHNPYNNKNISYIKGNPWYDEVLLRANIKYAKRIIVLADRNLKNKDMMDAKSVLICLAINKLNKNIYLISEVANHSNKKLFLRANVNDILISNEIESKILVRSILYKGINKAMKELITNSYGCELYEASISEEYINNKYIDVSFKLLKKGITLIGYFRNGETYLNPKTNIKLQSNDILIYIAPNKIL